MRVKRLFKSKAILVIAMLANFVAFHPVAYGGMVSMSTLMADPVQITGRVVDAKGNPLPGVTVSVKGQKTATATDINGRFQIRAEKTAILVFQMIGFSKKEIPAASGSIINVSLEEDNQMMDEVVVVGYGSQKKRDLTGAVSSVKAEELIMSSSPDVGHMLKGKAAGLMIRENSAQPGGGMVIQIRGAGSLKASNVPLIVVDGFPISDLQQPATGGRYDAGTQSILNSFNPNDIESIEVLKDAGSTAIYGARAANGVILITTKKGKSGTPVVQYTNNFTFQNYNNSFDVLPLNEWMQVRNEAAWEQWNFDNNVAPYGTRTLEEAQADPINGQFRKSYTQNAIDNVGRGTDWLSLVTRDGKTQQHNVSVSGGTENTRYLLSGNYYNQDGIIKNSGFDRYSIRANVDQKINRYLNFGVNLTASRIDNLNSQLGDDQFENSGVIRAAIQQGPHIKAIDEDGNYPLNPQLTQQPNPYSLLTISDEGRVERLLLNSFLDINPIKDLTIKLKAGMDRGATSRHTYLPRTTLHGALEQGRASIGETDRDDYLLEATATYNKTLAKIHRFTILAGVSQQKTYDSFNSSGNTGFLTDAFLWNNLNAGSGTKTVNTSRLENMIASYFGRLNYSLKDRYLLTLTVRTDGASVFARNNKWGTFPSISGGWNIVEEPFLAGIKDVVSQFKIRAGYGKTGNASIGSNAFAAYNAYPAWLSGEDAVLIGASLIRLENPDLKWETTTEVNIGLDYELFRGKVNGSLEIYKREISDLLDLKPINSYHEVNEIMANVGKTQSKGFELTVSTNNMKRGTFNWKTIYTFSKFKDTWKERAPDWKPSVYQNTGDPIRARFARYSDGILQVGETVPVSQPELKPGMIKIKDIDGYVRDESGNPMVDENGRFRLTGAADGIIDEADTKLLGSEDPSLIVGFTNIFNYRNFSLQVDVNGMFGRQLADPNYTAYGITAAGIYSNGYNALATVKNRWTPENPSTTQPSSFYGWSPYSSGDFFLEKAWFLRLQNISLGYSLPKKVLGKVFSQARIHADAHNLFVISPYNGIDPETDAYTAAYPYIRSFTMGLNFTF